MFLGNGRRRSPGLTKNIRELTLIDCFKTLYALYELE